MARIFYQNEAVVEVDSETPILQASLRNGIPHTHVCYFNRISVITPHFRGQIDNFMGDGVMALFGVADPAHATLNAVRAGLAILRKWPTRFRPVARRTGR